MMYCQMFFVYKCHSCSMTMRYFPSPCDRISSTETSSAAAIFFKIRTFMVVVPFSILEIVMPDTSAFSASVSCPISLHFLIKRILSPICINSLFVTFPNKFTPISIVFSYLTFTNICLLLLYKLMFCFASVFYIFYFIYAK